MGLIVKPNTFSAGATIVASEHNSNFDTIYNAFNGNIENTNIKLNAAIADSKLDQITTAGKVSGAAITLLTSVPAAAGVIPAANLTSVAQKGANSDITSISGLTTALSIGQGGTGQKTAQTAIDALLPTQSGNSGKFLYTNATNCSWVDSAKTYIGKFSGTGASADVVVDVGFTPNKVKIFGWSIYSSKIYQSDGWFDGTNHSNYGMDRNYAITSDTTYTNCLDFAGGLATIVTASFATTNVTFKFSIGSAGAQTANYVYTVYSA